MPQLRSLSLMGPLNIFASSPNSIPSASGRHFWSTIFTSTINVGSRWRAEITRDGGRSMISSSVDIFLYPIHGFGTPATDLDQPSPQASQRNELAAIRTLVLASMHEA